MAKTKDNFKLVPDALEDFTTEWCDKVLKDGKCISTDVHISNVDVKRLSSDGGGLSGSMMIRLVPTYR